jgi:hypothetical protein
MRAVRRAIVVVVVAVSAGLSSIAGGCASGTSVVGAEGGAPSAGGGGGTVCSGTSGPSVCIDKSTFSAGESITVRFSGGPGQLKDWIAIYPASCCAPDCPSGSTLWKYCGSNTRDTPASGVTSGTVVIDTTANPCNWPLSPGDWEIFYLVNDGYTPIARLTFHIDGADGGASRKCSGGCGGGSGGGGGGCKSSSDCSGECPRCSSGHCDVGYVSSITGECVY